MIYNVKDYIAWDKIEGVGGSFYVKDVLEAMEK
jgi:hypothetical protein